MRMTLVIPATVSRSSSNAAVCMHWRYAYSRHAIDPTSTPLDRTDCRTVRSEGANSREGAPGSLQKIAEALGVTLGEFFAAAASQAGEEDMIVRPAASPSRDGTKD